MIDTGYSDKTTIQSIMVYKCNNKNYLVVTTGPEGMQIFDCEDLKKIHNFVVEGGAILEVTFTKSMNKIISGARSGVIRMHNVDDSEALQEERV